LKFADIADDGDVIVAFVCFASSFAA